jgi:MFS superfamily sulfate permease-like transporter
VENPDDETVPAVAVPKLDGSLFFATAEAVAERVRGLAESDPDLRLVVLDLDGADFVTLGRTTSTRRRRVRSTRARC